MFTILKGFFAKVDGSIKGVLVPEELYRSLLTSLGSGTTIGALMMLIQSIISHASAIFPNPTVATLVSMFLTLVLDLLRRQSQGDSPTVPVSNPVSPSA